MLAKLSKELFTLRGVVLGFLAYGVVHSLIRLSASTVLSMDDTKENVFTQAWQWGYLPDNPPLYEWLLKIIQYATGPTIFSFLLLKYILMTVGALFVFLAARRVLRDEYWAALTSFSLILLYQIGWNYHQAFTHSTLLFATISFCLWSFTRLHQDKGVTSYLLFGLAIGLGLMSKYNFAALLLSLLGAGLWVKETREDILNPCLLLSFLIAGVMVTPHLIWVGEHTAYFQSMLTETLGTEQGAHLERVGSGLAALLVAVVTFFLPFLIFALVFFRDAFRPQWAPRDDEDEALIEFMGRAALIGVALMAGGVIVLGVGDVSERYAMPFVFAGLFWFIGRMRSVCDEDAQSRGFAFSIAGFAALIILVRIAATVFVGPPYCKLCGDFIPYADIEQKVREKSSGPMTLIVMEEMTAGNMRRAFPEAQVTSLNLNFFDPIKQARPCLMVWSEQMARGPMPDWVKQNTNSSNTMQVVSSWDSPYKEHGWRTTEWQLTEITTSNKLYAAFCAPKQK